MMKNKKYQTSKLEFVVLGGSAFHRRSINPGESGGHRDVFSEFMSCASPLFAVFRHRYICLVEMFATGRQTFPNTVPNFLCHVLLCLQGGPCWGA